MKKNLQLGLPYFGGKQNQAKFMEALFPSSFKTYCEPFGGTMKNFLVSDLDCSNVVYNDISYYQANMMMAFKYPKRFLRECRKQLKPGGRLFHVGLTDTIKYKALLKEHYGSLFHTLSDYFAFSKPNPIGELKSVSWVDAVLYAFCLSHSTLGVPLKSFVYSHESNARPKFMSVLNNLPEFVKQRKFNKVNFHVGDAMQLIRQQDNADAFFVVDPGYFGMEHYYSNRSRKGTRQKVNNKVVKNLSNDKMHIELSQTLRKLEGKFMLCYYYHEDLEKLYPRNKYTWVVKGYRRPSANTAKSQTKKIEQGMEVLIMNYGEELGQNSFYKQHLLDSATALMPEADGRRTRGSYTLEFKHKVILMLESGLFKRKEILAALAIKSYNTLAKWLSEKKRIETTMVRLKQANDFLRELKKPLADKINAMTGNVLVPEKARNLIADLRQQAILSNKAIREMFGISARCVEDCFQEWYGQRIAVPMKTKIARLLTYWHKMAA
ncbi:DNA adenine methylase [Rufibacter sp. LB8]|uniref:DNA adenine methylase n=1 Tax=Rufibacter sp. LB8 TaxID=2777781 RepID=UPI00178C65A1|nr:DNA adenine methylase [Rufibacter sp. LB8]